MGKWLLPWNVKEKEDRSFSVVTALDFQENRKGGVGIMWHSALKSKETRRGKKTTRQGRAESVSIHKYVHVWIVQAEEL